MITDLTDSFFELAGTPNTRHTQSNWNASLFIKTSTSYLCDLRELDSKLNDLDRNIRSGSRFEKVAQSKMIVNVKQHLRRCEQNIKLLKGASVDIRSQRQMAQKLKESVLITMELKLLQATFRFKDIHLAYARQIAPKDSANASSEREINLSRSHFLEQPQAQALQEVATREYKEIQRSIHEISEMYRETMNVVRMQELLIDGIEGYVDQADSHVGEGRKNLSELHGKQQRNRAFIYRVFGVLYLVVFVYLVLLS